MVNLVSNRDFARGDDGALKPKDRFVDPIIVPRRIGVSLLATDRSLDQALFTLIHRITRWTNSRGKSRHKHVAHLGSNQASLTALS